MVLKMWYGKKKYGESKITPCPFCDKQSIAKNTQGIPVCQNHIHKLMPPMKCICGEVLDGPFTSKYGAFYTCNKTGCGNFGFDKTVKMNKEPKNYKINKAKMKQ